MLHMHSRSPSGFDLSCRLPQALWSARKPANVRSSNIHPSLIPMFCGAGFYGMRVHRLVHARGLRVSGCTVHFANEVYDEGPIVVQRCVAPW